MQQSFSWLEVKVAAQDTFSHVTRVQKHTAISPGQKTPDQSK